MDGEGSLNRLENYSRVEFSLMYARFPIFAILLVGGDYSESTKRCGTDFRWHIIEDDLMAVCWKEKPTPLIIMMDWAKLSRLNFLDKFIQRSRIVILLELSGPFAMRKWMDYDSSSDDALRSFIEWNVYGIVKTMVRNYNRKKWRAKWLHSIRCQWKSFMGRNGCFKKTPMICWPNVNLKLNRLTKCYFKMRSYWSGLDQAEIRRNLGKRKGWHNFI